MSSALTDDDVRLIRELAAERERLQSQANNLFAKAERLEREARALSTYQLAQKFGVAQRTVRGIVNRSDREKVK